MTKRDIQNAYFNWMCALVCENRFAEEISYKKLLTQLHNTEFVYTIVMDGNRAEDGIGLRDRFADDHDIANIERYLDGPCSILEMMLALAIKCEESIMDDPKMGNRTSQWFWTMIGNLGLGSMKDVRYNKVYVREVLKRFLSRDYEPNGKGGLFTVKNISADMRNVEIWRQLCWWTNDIC